MMVCADMALLFLFKYFIDGKEYAGFLHIAKFIVDGGAKHLHCRRQAHVGVDKRRDIEAMCPYGTIEYAVVIGKSLAVEQLLHGI